MASEAIAVTAVKTMAVIDIAYVCWEDFIVSVSVIDYTVTCQFPFKANILQG